MADAVVRALLEHSNLTVSVVVVTDTARDARVRHGLASASASLFAQGLAAGALMASLQKTDTRINLQLECDGPLRGYFVDAGTTGALRGYVKNPHVEVELREGAFQWRAALGNSGFLSVLRDLGGEYYRSSVELTAMQLEGDLNHYFAKSDQVQTHVALDVARTGEEGLGVVAGVLVQALPDGDVTELRRLAPLLTDGLRAWCGAGGGEPEALLAALFPGEATIARTPLRFQCTCSKERAMTTLMALGADEVQSIVDTMGSTAVTCQFCNTKHEITLNDLWDLLEQLGRPQLRN